jgi:hypothetical protein
MLIPTKAIAVQCEAQQRGKVQGFKPANGNKVMSI